MESSYGTGREHLRKLIRKDQTRQQLRSLLLAGAATAPASAADASYFDALRDRVHKGTNALPAPPIYVHKLK